MAPAAGRFDADMLDQLSAALAEHLGPAAYVIVSKAADSAADIYQLCMALSTHVPAADRNRFMSAALTLVRMSQPAASAPPPAPAPSAPPATSTPAGASPRAPEATRVNAETLALAAQRLAQYMGPIAQVLVAKEARDATTPADLWARLARYIADLNARKAFTASAPR